MILNFVIVGRRFECSARNGGRRERSVFRGPHLVRGSDPPQPVPPLLQLLLGGGDLAGPPSVPVPASIQALRQLEGGQHGKVPGLNCVDVARFLKKVLFLLQSSRSTEEEGGRAELNQTNHAASVQRNREAYREDPGQSEPRNPGPSFHLHTVSDSG